tara:strand:+ start:1788 stop:2366 length:579 start_codon:yes stop_codon:yes gene_type:complete
MKEKKFPLETFMGGWYMPAEICDELLDYFDYMKKYQAAGVVANEYGLQVNKEEKDSTELSISPGNLDGIIGVYRAKLQEVLNLYMKKYERSQNVDAFNIYQAYNFQKYPIGGGFKGWHCENTGKRGMHRHLVFMTYLNDVTDGGTEFWYQKIKTKAEKGLTLIWPAAWTHTHRGIVSKTKEKYIITGWYTFF